MAYKLCHFIKDDGKVCGSLALHRHIYCYFHNEKQKRLRRMAQMGRKLRDSAAKKRLKQYALNILRITR